MIIKCDVERIKKDANY